MDRPDDVIGRNRIFEFGDLLLGFIQSLRFFELWILNLGLSTDHDRIPLHLALGMDGQKKDQNQCGTDHFEHGRFPLFYSIGKSGPGLEEASLAC